MIISAIAALSLSYYAFQKPPIEYQNPPTGTLLIEFVPITKMASACAGAQGLQRGDRVWACSRGPLLLMPPPCDYPKEDSYAGQFCNLVGTNPSKYLALKAGSDFHWKSGAVVVPPPCESQPGILYAELLCHEFGHYNAERKGKQWQHFTGYKQQETKARQIHG